MTTENQARQALQVLIDKYYNLSEEDKRLLSEGNVMHQFIQPLLHNVLGWPTDDPAHFRYEQAIHRAGRADMMLKPDSGGAVFVEAKRFGVIKDLQQARKLLGGTITPGQLALPGMAIDRTGEEQQAINYAFQSNNTWAILTDFQHLRLFNARRDWLVLSFEKPEAYLDDFDLLWRLAYPNILRGSLDELSNQRLRADIDTAYLSFINEWREKLAQNIVQRRDRNPWVVREDGSLDLPLLRAIVQRFLDRLVIVRYAEDHLIMPAGTLESFYEIGIKNQYAVIQHMVADLFRAFDDIHNSALFAPSQADAVYIESAVLLPLLKKLYEARYRSMPADIMGNTYEQYLGKTLTLRGQTVTSTDNLETRKKQGSYYTPQVIVRYLVDHSLGRYLYGTENGRPDGTPIAGEARQTSADIRDLRVLDSACGSGSFLIYAYQVLAEFYEAEIARLNRLAETQMDALLAQGNVKPLELQAYIKPIQFEIDRIQDYPRLILESHLYGVDLDPQAAEIAVVNLMMRAMESRSMKTDQMLPLILNQNVKVGNGLVGLRAEDMTRSEWGPARAEIRKLRQELISTGHGERHDQIIRELQTASETLKAAMNPALGDYFPDVVAVRPFHWGAEFPEVFFDVEGNPLPNPGFTIILGNPPWEILKPDLREFYAQFDERIESRFSRAEVEKRIAELDAEDPTRRPTLEQTEKIVAQTVAYTRGSGAYTRQGRGDPATQKLFLERMYDLLRREGRLAYVIPSGIYTDLGTKELRQMLLDDGHIETLIGLSNVKNFFPEVDSRFKFTLLLAQKGIPAESFRAAFRIDLRVGVDAKTFPPFANDPASFMIIRRDSLARFNPGSLGVTEFQSVEDYKIIEKVYDSWPLLNEKLENWNIRLNREFDMANDRSLLNSLQHGIPYYEGKMVHQYDAFYEKPQYWIDKSEVTKLTAEIQREMQTYRVVHRRIASSTNERTLISAIVPKNSACDTNATMVLIEGNSDERLKLYVCGLLNSFVLDYVMRYKISTTLNMFFMQSLPLPRLEPGNPYFDQIVPRAARLTCTRPEFADLWQSVMGNPWTESSGAVDPGERQQLRNEIDALVAHLYGLSAEELNHVLAAFPLVAEGIKAGVREAFAGMQRGS